MNQTSIDGNDSHLDSSRLTVFSFNTLLVLVSFNLGSTVKSWSLYFSYEIPVACKDLVPYVSYSQIAQNFLDGAGDNFSLSLLDKELLREL